MGLQATILDGRVYFGPFDKGNDRNPKTQRSGLDFFRFNLIGWLVEKILGTAHKVHYSEGKKHGVVYLKSKDFIAWKKRHEDDAGLDKEALNQALSKKDFEKAIKIICDNFFNHRKNNGIDNISNIPKENSHLPKPQKILEDSKGPGKTIEIQEAELSKNKDSQISAIPFGKQQWAELGLEVEDLPLPKGIEEILKSPCPYSKNGETVEQTYVLVLRPGSIDGEVLDAENFGKFMKSKFPELKEGGYDFITSECKKLKSDGKPCWILMKKDLIDGSQNKSYFEQKAMVEELGKGKCHISKGLDLIVSTMAEYARSKTRLFSKNSWTYARCLELDYRVLVGNFKETGLYIITNDSVLEGTGVVAQWKL